MRWLAGLFSILVLILVGLWMWTARHPTLDPINAAEEPRDEDLVKHGERLASIGGCASCHGGDLSGGEAIPTPFGAIHATNITPDAETGIGRWSEAAFQRAMRKGIDREGGHLYPAFPYDSFTNLTDEDLAALYAYLMSGPAIAKTAPANTLAFPYNIRPLMAFWNALHLEEGPLAPDPARDEAWNRGAYLAEGPGHCAACHSPRNELGARDRKQDYEGAMAEGWWSPALGSTSTATMPWTEDELINYLYDGWDENHGIAAGPMKDVVANISILPEDDMAALVRYLMSLGERADVDRDIARADAEGRAFASTIETVETGNPALDHGAEVFVARCANCHRTGSETVPLALATTLTGPRPENFLKVVIDGVTPTENAYFVRPMPGNPELSREELRDLAAFSRHRFTNAAPWTELEQALDRLSD
jgi:mono/diheme cytochrome c family protein